MDTADLFADAASRPVDVARVTLEGIDADTLHLMPLGRGNSIAWLVWHAARQADVQLAALTGGTTVWVDGGWADRLGIARDDDDFGLGDDRDAVAALHVADAGLLLEHLAAVMARLTAWARTLSPADLDEVVDRRWDPPVARGVRLVSIIDDAVAHLAQASYVRGLTQEFSVGA